MRRRVDKRWNSPSTCLAGKSVLPPTFDIADPAIRLSAPVERAERGEDVVISRNGVPSARIVPLRPPVTRTIEAILRERSGRRPSSAAGNRAARDEGRR